LLIAVEFAFHGGDIDNVPVWMWRTLHQWSQPAIENNDIKA